MSEETVCTMISGTQVSTMTHTLNIRSNGKSMGFMFNDSLCLYPAKNLNREDVEKLIGFLTEALNND